MLCLSRFNCLDDYVRGYCFIGRLGGLNFLLLLKKLLYYCKLLLLMLAKVKLRLCLTFRRMILQRSYILLTNVGENGK